MPTGNDETVVRRASWPDDEPAIRRIREAVFVREQSVPLELEWDGKDPEFFQVLACDPDGKAVGAERRRGGVGSALLRTLLAVAREQGLRSVYLNAQTEACGFYAGHGFRAEGEVFLDAGIPHRRMVRDV